MKTKYRISTAAFLAAASLTFSSPAWSLGLGEVTVESYLNQPLQVKIDLITRETDDLAAVTAQLASADDYELIGASRDAIPVPIRFTVEDLEGEPYLLGTSNLPIGNPVVRLIIEVTYAHSSSPGANSKGGPAQKPACQRARAGCCFGNCRIVP
jgi:pilus assembly protein FimV